MDSPNSNLNSASSENDEIIFRGIFEYVLNIITRFLIVLTVD